MSSHIPYTVPSVTELEVAYATDAARNGWGEACYDYIERFEEAFSQHLHVRHAIATSSCTGATHLGLLPSFHAMTKDQFNRICSVVEVVADSQWPRELL